MREKGTPKTGGREKGTPNKVTKELREFIKDLIDENRELIKTDLSQIEPKDRIKIMLELMRFVIPTLKSVDEFKDENKTYTISFVD